MPPAASPVVSGETDVDILYERIGYTPNPVLSPYTGFSGSLCFEKQLVQAAA